MRKVNNASQRLKNDADSGSSEMIINNKQQPQKHLHTYGNQTVAGFGELRPWNKTYGETSGKLFFYIQAQF